MVYLREYGYPIHKDCVNFRNGFCTLIGVGVDPNGSACPRFSPRRKMKTLPAEATYPEVRRSYPMYPPQIGLVLPERRGSVHVRGIRDGKGRDRIRNRTVRTQEKEALIQQFKELEKQLKDIRQRLKKL